ncbi:hypothetical protein F7R91_05405 [Streptomyces luteolifulvus]|uniref:Uncharacterized protein n=1 Tax=Streptomyces luteolifulvus TaxID=2615112 RepID=A0A6H9V323_9ACTN|nr:hypothetical protein [Streptomyces luteolifulvus]KAB1149198.1 hypothetical protein F7R91_05405 [Streptomyces luteolifulvus]
MLRATWTPGRRGAVIGAAAAVACLGGVPAACGGGGGGGGYVAIGAGGGPSPRASGTAVAPTGGVTLVPLDARPGGKADGDSPGGSGGGSGGPSAVPGPTPGARATADSPGPSADGAEPGRTAPSAPSASPSASRTVAPTGPAALSWGAPEREPTEKRWCEKVTVEFRNSGGTGVRSGTVTFGTHIIGALGIDWGTIESTEDLPAPIGAGARKEKTWTVCVDAWRVPLGMHIETRDVSVRWS